MIKTVAGNLLAAQAEALVNTVNCVGVMGKGIALQFKQAFPLMFKAYEKEAKAGRVVPGKMHLFETGTFELPWFIINFPTKRHWRDKSLLEDIDAGLVDLVAQVKRLNIRSIAIPPLGSGNGGLNWNDVRPRIEAAFAGLPEVEVLLYDSQKEPAPEERIVRTNRPALTEARALFLASMGLYLRFDYSLSQLEVQKLAYFLQSAGQPLRLDFQKAPYGPYADNLNHVLRLLEGHYLLGAIDTKPNTEIKPLPDAIAQAETFLSSYPEAQARLKRVEALIEGFETPFGMELLSTVHWVASHQESANLEHCVREVQAWSERKQKLFKPEHIHLAWQRLQAEAWLPVGLPSSRKAQNYSLSSE